MSRPAFTDEDRKECPVCHAGFQPVLSDGLCPNCVPDKQIPTDDKALAASEQKISGDSR